MQKPTPEARNAGVTIIDIACVFAVISVVGWQAVPYLLAGGIALLVLIVAIALMVLGLIRLMPFLLSRH